MARGDLRAAQAIKQWRGSREGRVFTNTDYPHDPRGRDFRDRPVSGAALLALAGFVGLPLLVGAADAAVTAGSVRAWYLSLLQPPGTPPNWVFGPVWTVLYVLIGIAAWLVWRAGTSDPLPLSGGRHLGPLRLWGWQLLFNAAWAPAFFGLHRPWLALLVMPPLLALIAATAVAFWRVRRAAGSLLLPYLAWTCYATYVTAGFWWLNPHA